jgi:hypothetical protein
MSDKPDEGIKDYADGWITERKGKDVPGFLKLAFPLIGLFCLAYLFLYMNGEVNHADRGMLVQKFNEMTRSSSALMYAVAATALVYLAVVVAFVIRKFHED